MSKCNFLSSEAADDVTRHDIGQDLQIKPGRSARSRLYGKNPAIASIVEDAGITPLVKALDSLDLQHQALDVLSKVVFGSSEHTAAVINSEVIPKLISFLTYEDNLADWQIRLAERAILILGNIALHGPAARRGVLARGAVRAMLPHMRTDAPVRRLRTFVRAYSNMCSHDVDKTHLELVSPALPYIHDILNIENEESLDPDDKETPFIACDVIVDACTALTNIMLGPDECIEAVQLVPGLTARLAALLGHEAAAVREAALGALGNMLAGTDAQVDRCLDANCLDHIESLLQSSSPSLVSTAARATGNILAGTHPQIQRALDKDILAPLQTILADGDSECKKQALYAVTNLCYNGSAVQRAGLVLSGALQPYCALLAAEDRAVAGEVLDGLNALTQAAEREGSVKPLCFMLDELDVLDHTQLLLERGTDEDRLCKLSNITSTLRQHAREERTIVHDGVSFTLQKIREDLNSEYLATKKRAVLAAFAIITENKTFSAVNALAEAGIIPPLVKMLNCPDVQTIVTAALAYISKKRKHRMAILDTDTLPTLLALLVNENQAAILAAGTLGNIALYGPETREAVLAYVQHSETALEDLRTYTRFFKAFTSQLRQESNKNYRLITTRALPFVSELLVIEDQQILDDVCRGCANLMIIPIDHGIEEVQAVPGLTARLVELLGHGATNVREAALRALANMLIGTDAQADRWVDAGCLDHVIPLMQSTKPTLAKLATLATRNLLFHKQSHIQQALEKDALTPLRNILAEGDAVSQLHAAYAITNICYNGSAVQRARLVLSGALQPYCALLADRDRAVANLVLGGLYELIQDAKKIEKAMPLYLKLAQIGVIGQLQKIQARETDNDLRLKAVALSCVLRYTTIKEQVTYEDGKFFTIQKIVTDLKSQDLETQLVAARAARSMLHNEHDPRTAMVQAGVVPLLAAALDRHDCSEIRHAAADALLKIVDGTQRHRTAVIDSGTIPKLVALVADGGEAAGSAAMALGNLSSRAPAARDLALTHGAVEAMLPHLHRDAPTGLLMSCVVAYTNFCMVPVSSSMSGRVISALPNISELLDVEDKLILRQACLAVAHLMSALEVTEVFLSVPGLTARLVALMNHKDAEVKQAAISTVGEVLAGTEIEVDRFVEAGCLDSILSLLKCSETFLVAEAARAVANLFRLKNSSVQRALEMDFLTPLVNILTDAEPNSFVQYHAACAFANLTRGILEHKIAIVHAGAIPKLVALLSHEAAVSEAAMCALGNIAGGGLDTAYEVLTHGAMQAMMPYMHANIPLDLLKICLDTYTNLCAGIVLPASSSLCSSMLELVSPGLPYISAILMEVGDQDVLQTACKALHNIMHGPDECIEAVQLVPGLTARLVALLGHEGAIVKEAAMNVLINMLYGTETQVERCLDAGCLDYIEAFLDYRGSPLVEKAVQALGKMVRYIPAIQRAPQKNLLIPLLNIIANENPNSSVQFIATSVFNNLSARSSLEQIMAVVDSGAIPKLVPLLSHEAAVAEVAALSLGSIAEADPGAKDLVRAHGAVPAIKLLMRPDKPLKLWISCLLAYEQIRSHEEDDEEELLELVSPLLPRIVELQDTGDKQDTILLERSYGMALIVLMETNEGIEAVQATPGLTARLVGLLEHETARVKRVVIYAVMLMLSGADTQVDRCLAANCVEHIISYLECRDPSLMEAAVKATRDVLGAEHPLQPALDEDSVTPLMTTLACSSEEQQRVVKAISKLWCRVAPAQRARLVSCGALQPVGALLAARDWPRAGAALAALYDLLKVARADGTLKQFCQQLVEMGVRDQLELLRDHEDKDISEIARRLLRAYFHRRQLPTQFSHYFLKLCFQLTYEVWNQL